MDRRRRLTWLKRVLVPTFLVALFIASATIAWASEPAQQAATVNIEVGDSFFQPQVVTVNVGDTVVWTVTAPRFPHDVTAKNEAFVSPRLLRTGATFSWTATAPGTYDYVCTIHERMGHVGTLIVQGAGGTGGAPTAPPRTGSGGMAGGRSPMLLLALLSVGLGVATGLVCGLRRRQA